MNSSRFAKAVRIGIFTLALSLAPFTAVSTAQPSGGSTGSTGSTGSGGSGGSTSSGGSTGMGSSTGNATRTEGRGFDWGWLGLLGLIGLSGRVRRNDQDRATTVRS